MEGRALDASHFELVADRKSGLRPGDTIKLGRNRFTVTGLTDGVINSGGDPAVFMTIADAMALQTELDPSAERVQVARNATSVSPPPWRPSSQGSTLRQIRPC